MPILCGDHFYSSKSITKFWTNNESLRNHHFFVILRCPWDQYTIIGWILEIIFSIWCSITYYTINNAFQSFFIGICYFHKAFYKQLRAIVDKLGKTSDEESTENAKVVLTEAVQFHNSAKKSFELSSEVYSILILNIQICSMVILACCIFQVDLVRESFINHRFQYCLNHNFICFLQSMKHLDWGILLLFIGIAAAISNLFLYCYFGQFAHDYYLDIANCYYNANWLTLPSNIQKYFVLLIANAQRPLRYHGLGLAFVDLNTFLRVKFIYTFFKLLVFLS